MRSLFILLFIINFCYLTWGVAFSDKNEPIVSDEPIQSSRSITLIKESLQNDDESVKKKLKNSLVISKIEDQQEDFEEESNEKTQSRLCFSIGPFLEEEKYQAFVKDLLNGNFKPTIKSIKDKEPQSYWVYIPAMKSKNEATKTASELKTENVKDYFVVLNGENINAISLGLYNSYKRAMLRKDKLTKLGFDVNVETRYSDVIRYWVDYQENDAEPLQDDIWAKNDKDNLLQKIARPCVDPLPETR